MPSAPSGSPAEAPRRSVPSSGRASRAAGDSDSGCSPSLARNAYTLDRATRQVSHTIVNGYGLWVAGPTRPAASRASSARPRTHLFSRSSACSSTRIVSSPQLRPSPHQFASRKMHMSPQSIRNIWVKHQRQAAGRRRNASSSRTKVARSPTNGGQFPVGNGSTVLMSNKVFEEWGRILRRRKGHGRRAPRPVPYREHSGNSYRMRRHAERSGGDPSAGAGRNESRSTGVPKSGRHVTTSPARPRCPAPVALLPPARAGQPQNRDIFRADWRFPRAGCQKTGGFLLMT